MEKLYETACTGFQKLGEELTMSAILRQSNAWQKSKFIEIYDPERKEGQGGLCITLDEKYTIVVFVTLINSWKYGKHARTSIYTTLLENRSSEKITTRQWIFSHATMYEMIRIVFPVTRDVHRWDDTNWMNIQSRDVSCQYSMFMEDIQLSTNIQSRNMKRDDTHRISSYATWRIDETYFQSRNVTDRYDLSRLIVITLLAIQPSVNWVRYGTNIGWISYKCYTNNTV
jgi:hypothetical protein